MFNFDSKGSCWTFSATGSIEGAYFVKYKTLIKLSEQNLIDCNRNEKGGNFGCNGGDMAVAFKYLNLNRGINPLSKYPYTGRDGSRCFYNSTYNVTSLANYQFLPAGNETLMMYALNEKGPFSCAIDSSLASFQSYKSGIYNDPACSRALNHGMLLVGYGTENGIDYWLIKNSYGTSWGLRGYMKLQRGVNRCGIADYVVYPII